MKGSVAQQMVRPVVEKYSPIRSISRSIFILQAINRSGTLSMTEIAQASDLPYATVFRIVQALVHEGLLEREPVRKRYRATALVHSLSQGYQSRNRLVTAARTHIVALTHAVVWPITITTRTGAVMIIRDSTHQLTSLTLNDYRPGYTFPILECSSGRAYVAFCDENERQTIFKGLRAEPGPISLDRLAHYEAAATLTRIRELGYATKARNRFTEDPGKTSSIAVPIFENEDLAGAMTLTFFASAVSMVASIDRYVERMKVAARAVGDTLTTGDTHV